MPAVDREYVENMINNHIVSVNSRITNAVLNSRSTAILRSDDSVSTVLTCRDFYDCPRVEERPFSTRHHCPHADGSAVARISVGLRRKIPVSAVLCRSAFQNLHPPCCVIEQCTITEKLLTESYPRHKQTFSVGIYNEQSDTAGEFFSPLQKKISNIFFICIYFYLRYLILI